MNAISTFCLAACAVAFTTLANAQVVINEFVAKNDSVGGYQEPDGGYGDWIELYNRGNSAVNLSGYNLSDDLGELDKWEFPAGVSIAANGYLIVWADDDEDQTGVHTTFKLSGSGEDVVLSQNGNILDQYSFGEQDDNIAEARIPNGTGAFVKRTPTPLASNESSATQQPKALQLRAYPSMVGTVVSVDVPTSLSFARYEVLDALGGIQRKGSIDSGSDQVQVDVAGLATGSYILSFDGGRAVAKFSKQ